MTISKMYGTAVKIFNFFILYAVGTELLDEFVDSAHATRSFAGGLL